MAPCPGGCSRRPRWPVHLRFALMLSLARGVIVAYEVREPPRPHGRSRSHGSHMRLAFSTSSPAIWLSFCSGADPTGRSSRCCCNSRVGPRLRSVFACRGGDRRRRFERLDDIIPCAGLWRQAAQATAHARVTRRRAAMRHVGSCAKSSRICAMGYGARARAVSASSHCTYVLDTQL